MLLLFDKYICILPQEWCSHSDDDKACFSMVLALVCNTASAEWSLLQWAGGALLCSTAVRTGPTYSTTKRKRQ